LLAICPQPHWASMTTVALNSDFIVGWLSGMIDFLSIAAVY